VPKRTRPRRPHSAPHGGCQRPCAHRRLARSTLGTPSTPPSPPCTPLPPHCCLQTRKAAVSDALPTSPRAPALGKPFSDCIGSVCMASACVCGTLPTWCPMPHATQCKAEQTRARGATLTCAPRTPSTSASTFLRRCRQYSLTHCVCVCVCVCVCTCAYTCACACTCILSICICICKCISDGGGTRKECRSGAGRCGPGVLSDGICLSNAVIHACTHASFLNACVYTHVLNACIQVFGMLVHRCVRHGNVVYHWAAAPRRLG